MSGCWVFCIFSTSVIGMLQFYDKFHFFTYIEYDHAHDDVIYGHSVEENDSGVSPSTGRYI